MTAMPHEKPLGEDPPLVTFALFAYNQEKYIREAVEGAFAQTYEPLEIILSDDCSTDRTFEIMQDMVASYKGPHQVRLYRNPENLGTLAHVSKIDHMATGRLIVHAAGDDISLPNRVQAIFHAWKSAKLKPSLIVSNVINFKDNGDLLGLTIDPSIPLMHKRLFNPLASGNFIKYLGCSMAIDSELVDNFESMRDRALAEDVILHWRAHILNGVLYIPDQLVKYRFGLGVSRVFNNTRGEILNKNIQMIRDKVILLKQFSRDARVIKNIFRSIFLRLAISLALMHNMSLLKSLSSTMIVGAPIFLFDFLVWPESYKKKKEHLRLFLIKWKPELVNVAQ